MIGGKCSAPPASQWRLPRCSFWFQPFQNVPKCPKWLRVSRCVPQWTYIWIASPAYEYFSSRCGGAPARPSMTEPSGVCVIQMS